MHWVRNGAIALTLVLLGALVWVALRPAAPQLPVNTRLGGAITLVNQDGQTFNTTALNGKVVLLFFGYTHCPDICPATLARVTQAWNRLRKAGHADDTAVVFVTFDPARDSAAHLKQYLQFFDPAIIGLTGSPAQIKVAAEKYGVVYLPDSSEGKDAPVLFTHSDFIYLLDTVGRVRKLYPSDANIEEIVNDAKTLF